MSEPNLSIPTNSGALRIRRFKRGDSGPFVNFMTDTESTKFLTFGEEQKSRNGAKALLEATINSYDTEEPMMAFAVEELATKRFVGFCGLTPREEGAVEIMYAVIPDVRRKGHATQIAVTLAQHAICQLGYKRVIAPISPAHESSKAVATKAGFADRGIIQESSRTRVVQLFVFEREQLIG